MLNKIRLMPALKCSADESIVNVAKQLKNEIQRHIYVVDKNNFPIGIISTTDMNNKVVALGKNPKFLTAKDIMTKDIEVYDINEDPLEVFKEMKQNRRIAVAVVKDRQFHGVLPFNSLISYITHMR